MVMTAGTEASVLQHTLYTVQAQIRNLAKVSKKDRDNCEQVLNAAIEQARILIDLSRPGKLELSEYKFLRDQTSSSLRDQLTTLGINTTETWKKPIHILAIRDNTALALILRQHPKLRKDLNDLFSKMYQAFDELEKIPALEHFVSSPPADPFDKPSAEITERRIRHGIAALLVLKPQLGRALDSLLLDANAFVAEKEQTLALARANVEKWFDATMDRTNGWYKRNEPCAY
jgi:hypothetical protein